MRSCVVCKKRYYKGDGNLFSVPRDISDLTRWSKICGVDLRPTNLICAHHFLPSNIVNVGKTTCLLPNAEPLMRRYEDIPTKMNEKYIHAPKQSENVIFENLEEEIAQNLTTLNENVSSAQVQNAEIKIPVIKTVFRSESTQTNTRICGLVQTSDFVNEFRFNCFYCTTVFPVKKWKLFINHLKKKHFEEEAFKMSKYISVDHDYTPICQPPSISADTDIKIVTIKPKPTQSNFEDPLEPTFTPFESIVFDTSFYSIPTGEETIFSNVLNNFILSDNPRITDPILEIDNKLDCFKNKRSLTTKTQCFKNFEIKSSKNKTSSENTSSSESKVISSGVLYIKDMKRQPSRRKSALSRCLRRTNLEAVKLDEKDHISISIDNIQQKPTEIAFEYTPGDIVELLIDSMKNYPAIWQFDAERFNENYYEACESLCQIINKKWALNIDNLTMRRSINRILRFYCSLYPNSNVENIDKFTNYYDKCAAFLPACVNEIAYARCSHCYICYKNDFDLKRHLLEEQRYLQWPYKCVQCKECFRESDEYEFHKLLPHYDEIFRCKHCNKTFDRGNIYNKHVADKHQKTNSVEFKCVLCEKSYQTKDRLRRHELIHGERNYKCHLCPKSYYTNAKLRLHLKSHRKEYDFVCELCGKPFFTHGALNCHMKKHTGAKVTCNICNIKLRQSSLRRHQRLVHVAYEGTIEATYRAKSYHYNEFLGIKTLRRRKKSGRRQFRCKVCEINFENRKSIVQHNKELHSNEHKWSCKICKTEFNSKIYLHSHYRKKHNLPTIEIFTQNYENYNLQESVNDLAGNENGSELPGDYSIEVENVYCSEMPYEIIESFDNEPQEIDFMDDVCTDISNLQ